MEKITYIHNLGRSGRCKNPSPTQEELDETNATVSELRDLLMALS